MKNPQFNDAESSAQMLNLLTKIEANTAVTRLWATRLAAIVVAILMSVLLVMIARPVAFLFYQ